MKGTSKMSRRPAVVGNMTYTNNNDSYEGDFKDDGKFSARGVFKLASSGNCYDGEWKDDQKKLEEVS